MEELTALQQGYYYLSKHQFDEAKQHFGSLVTEKCDDPHPYIGLLLAENGLVSEGGLADLPKPLEDYPLYMEGLSHAKGSYRESLMELRAKQNLRLLRKEEDYGRLSEGMSALSYDKKEAEELLRLASGLRDYKKSGEFALILKDRLTEIEELARQKRKKRNMILIPLISLVSVALLVGLFLFTLPAKDGVRYVLTLDGYATLSCDEALTEVTVAKEIFGIDVRHVGRSSFKDHTALEKVTLHEGITAIEKSAFNGCTALLSVEGAQNVSTVYSKAFKDCATLRTLTVKEGAYVEDNAFRGCSRGITVYAGKTLLTVRTESKGSNE